jgi:ribosome-binding ATPase YchF (GTP1/OBG family)
MGPVDPVRDREVINIELGLADLATVEKRLDKTARTAKSGDPQAKLEARLLESIRDALSGRATGPGRGAHR